MTANEKVRERVSQSYAQAVTSTGETGCCGGRVPKGVLVKVAGYTEEELRGLPDEALVSAFGCGNPLALSEVQPGHVVVDLGSGAGIDILLAGRKVGPEGRVIGIDMTDEMIARAEASITASGYTHVEVRKGLIEEMPVESGTADWVISNCVINLSPEKERVFAEIYRVLKPGGRMRVADIVVESLPEWVRASPALYDTCVGGAISEGEYLEGLRRAGLEEVEVVDRQVYDAVQLAGLVESEIPGAVEVLKGKISLDEVARQLEGKVWSARFAARKGEASA